MERMMGEAQPEMQQHMEKMESPPPAMERMMRSPAMQRMMSTG